MSEFSRPIPLPPAKDAVVDGEVVAPAPSSRTGDPMVAAFTGPQAAPRVDAVRRGLDRALDDWWRNGALPAPGLLRDSLRLLEACLLYTSPSPRDRTRSRMPSSA